MPAAEYQTGWTDFDPRSAARVYSRFCSGSEGKTWLASAGLEPGDADPAEIREFHDWTNGCVALFNPDIRELYEFVPDGTPVTIVANGPITTPRY